MGKFKNIEFLRVLLIFGIIMHHAFISVEWSLFQMFPKSSLYLF